MTLFAGSPTDNNANFFFFDGAMSSSAPACVQAGVVKLGRTRTAGILKPRLHQNRH